MELSDATLDHKMCELFTRLYVEGEQCGDGGSLRRFPGLQRDGSSEVAAYPLGLGSVTTHTQPTPQSSDVVMGGHLLAARATRSGVDWHLYRVLGILSQFEALGSAGNTIW